MILPKWMGIRYLRLQKDAWELFELFFFLSLFLVDLKKTEHRQITFLLHTLTYSISICFTQCDINEMDGTRFQLFCINSLQERALHFLSFYLFSAVIHTSICLYIIIFLFIYIVSDAKTNKWRNIFIRWIEIFTACSRIIANFNQVNRMCTNDNKNKEKKKYQIFSHSSYSFNGNPAFNFFFLVILLSVFY